MEYKLIKSYPNSRETGTIVSPVPQPDTASKTSRYIDSSGRYYGWHEVEDYPEYWEEIKEPTFKVGDWVFKPRENIVYCITKFDKEGWAVGDTPGGGWHPNQLRLATTEEIENHLIAEAKKRGFVEGIKFKGVTHPKGKNGFQVTCSKVYFAPVHSYNLGCYLYSNNEYIYLDGQLAEIVKEEEIKIGEYIARFDFSNSGPNTVSFGCKKYTFSEIISLYETCLVFGVSQVYAHNHLVEWMTIKKIYDEIKKQR